VSEQTPRTHDEPQRNARWIPAPPDSDCSAANRILGVWVAPGERVRWEWSVLPGGRPYVCGYTIEQPWRAVAPPPRSCGFHGSE
jgi:hypothetical protein